MKIRVWSALSIFALMWQPLVHADDETFDVAKFQVEGNTILSVAEVEHLVSPFAGPKRTYAHIQRALEALEEAYRSRGFGTVQVYVPEQELTSGIVKIQVAETVVGKVVVTNNKYHSHANILETLPQLQVGKSPNLRQISENVQLANENPSKQIEVTLGVSEEEGKVDAKVQVEDEDLQKIILTLDNTGDKVKTGQYRTGITLRDANLLGHDEVLTFGYLTSPDAPGGVNMDVFSVGLRIPFYNLGDSLDVIYGTSSVNTPSSVTGGLSFTGKGDIWAIRWNHLFPREGEYTSKFVSGFDQKVTLCDGGAAGPIANCVNTTLRLLSGTYSGQWVTPKFSADFNAGISYSIPLGERQDGWRYNLAAGGRAAIMDFYVLRAGGSYSMPLGDWLIRGAVTAQYADTPMPSGEQLGLTGSSAVRGFGERVQAADSGYVANLELYTPDLAPSFNKSSGRNIPGTLRALAFFDWAQGQSWTTGSYMTQAGITTASSTSFNEHILLSSFGVGLRYGLGKDVSAKFDWAKVIHSAPTSRGTPSGRADEDWMAHFAISYGF
jgi:hemolysin activation/secretion protein